MRYEVMTDLGTSFVLYAAKDALDALSQARAEMEPTQWKSERFVAVRPARKEGA